MSLARYREKRTFSATPEPTGGRSDSEVLHFVVQQHEASHMHYDFRLEIRGVLKSWAVPKGPSMDPRVKHLAMMVEDHPYNYKDFEGIIPPGNYGAGTVIVWDQGWYEPDVPAKNKKAAEKALLKELDSGKLKFFLHGDKLKGEFVLVKAPARGDNAWLLIKMKDEFASAADILRKNKSVVSGKTITQVKKSPERVWESSQKKSTTKHTPKAAVKKAAPSAINIGKKAAMPEGVKPMLATLANKPFDNADWLYEIKWDGYRAIGYCNKEKAHIVSRNQLSFDKKFPVITEALKEWNVKAVVDGEIVAPDENGDPDFQQLQNYLKFGSSTQIVYYIFDLLWYEGRDLRQEPLLTRKTLLQQILPPEDNLIRYSDHIIENGKAFYEAAVKRGLEGVMAKNANGAYVSGRRTDSWLKIKNNQFTEAVICGYTKGRNSRKYFGAIVLGKYKGSKLQYIGHTGGGFSDQQLRELYAKFQPLVTDHSPFKPVPDTNMPVTWMKPLLVCAVKYAEITTEGILRQPIFMGLREDKKAATEKNEKIVTAPPDKLTTSKKSSNMATATSAKAKTAEAKKTPAKKAAVKKTTPKKTAATSSEKKTTTSARKKKAITKPSKNSGNDFLPAGETEVEMKVDGRLLKFTNLDKVYWPVEKITKGDMINYYASVVDYILPYLKDRPQSLNRFPEGINGFHFYQKNVEDKVADWIETFPYLSESDGQTKSFLVCKDKATLLYMANLGCIELNPWHSRISKPDNPDYCLIDLDPDKNPFSQVVETALVVKSVLDEIGAESYVKTSGSSGMHILVPLGARYSYEQSRMLAQLVTGVVNKRLPDTTSVVRTPAKRKGLIYLDFLQNRQIQTMAVAYSLRPKPGATISAPLSWKEVKAGLNMKDFNINTMPARLAAKGDLLKGLLGKGINLNQVLDKLQHLL
ncbi:non-homologous end-joining DNA ligase [Chitinophaga sp. Cy-1792]|uniref:non-homologous end-joining DNA ligase n=1 Tax=Chitinophaga sp. Cy-1792 TaxID=2608339 RepID=UPI001424658B|nr:non-homologous end-joining DNA ligase [Chitinophaga sp. Cy-1792]NIG54756.1 DNA ligase [Chitinophaga sp. Cy-1792]